MRFISYVPEAKPHCQLVLLNPHTGNIVTRFSNGKPSTEPFDDPGDIVVDEGILNNSEAAIRTYRWLEGISDSAMLARLDQRGYVKPSSVLKAAWNLVNNTGCVGCKAISKAALRLRTDYREAQAFFNKYRPEGKDQNDIWWPRGDIRSRLDALAAAIKDAEEAGQ